MNPLGVLPFPPVSMKAHNAIRQAVITLFAACLVVCLAAVSQGLGALWVKHAELHGRGVFTFPAGVADDSMKSSITHPANPWTPRL